jgi:hypothetical protein
MSTLLGSVKISDVPEVVAPKLNVPVATVGEVVQKEASNGYIAIRVPLEYEDAQGNERTFTAKFNVRPEWFDSAYKVPVGAEQGTPEYKEAISYQINMQRYTRGLFKAAGLDDIDFDQVEGSVIGFTAGPNSKDKSQLEVKSFYKAR